MRVSLTVERDAPPFAHRLAQDAETEIDRTTEELLRLVRAQAVVLADQSGASADLQRRVGVLENG